MSVFSTLYAKFYLRPNSFMHTAGPLFPAVQPEEGPHELGHCRLCRPIANGG